MAKLYLDEEWIGGGSAIVFPNLCSCVGLAIEIQNPTMYTFVGVHLTIGTKANGWTLMQQQLTTLMGGNRAAAVYLIGNLGEFKQHQTAAIKLSKIAGTFKTWLGKDVPVWAFDTMKAACGGDGSAGYVGKTFPPSTSVAYVAKSDYTPGGTGDKNADLTGVVKVRGGSGFEALKAPLPAKKPTFNRPWIYVHGTQLERLKA